MYIRVHPQDPEQRKIASIADCLKNDGVIIYPTDTVYGIGASIFSTKATERIYRIKNLNAKTARLSIICNSISELSLYIRSLDTATFKMLKKNLPGPYTFILEGSRELPKLLKTKRNTVGIRIPDNKICSAIVEKLGVPIISTSLPERANIEDYTDPEVFAEYFENEVDLIIDGGIGSYIASTVVDCTSVPAVITREGAGLTELIL
jgi:tRNA threonylcarbamoyl adenosine modification protein (Sua5/YciO/YrdC/YwlC family)